MKIIIIASILITTLSSFISFAQTGSVTDKRDGKTYKTIRIGTQTWMAENVAWYTAEECRAFDDDEANVGKYGYLYTWKVAKAACPAGWHLPSDAEANTLSEFLGGDDMAGNKLKSTILWEAPASPATNSSGFNALPGGYYRFDARFNNLGTMATMWLATEVDAESAYYRLLTNDESGFYRNKSGKAYSYSVRCIKD
jgi:uncharacterized protein (TIGR02145 family)